MSDSQPCPSEITIAGRMLDDVAISCDQAAGHNRTHTATIEAETTITVNNQPKTATVSVYLVW